MPFGENLREGPGLDLPKHRAGDTTGDLLRVTVLVRLDPDLPRASACGAGRPPHDHPPGADALLHLNALARR
ncbi:hypothetical protein E4K10_26800 [Streptomyces sp. T1317-0309]|nr:hypothetical protein E4K10_26800 [Streptomyces sp. T1317-0309]